MATIEGITTKEIGECLDIAYPDGSNDPIDYFYVQLRKQYVNVKVLRNHDPTRAILDASKQCGGMPLIKKSCIR